jgi:hypothetical protein
MVVAYTKRKIEFTGARSISFTVPCVKGRMDMIIVAGIGVAVCIGYIVWQY